MFLLLPAGGIYPVMLWCELTNSNRRFSSVFCLVLSSFLCMFNLMRSSYRDSLSLSRSSFNILRSSLNLSLFALKNPIFSLSAWSLSASPFSFDASLSNKSRSIACLSSCSWRRSLSCATERFSSSYSYSRSIYSRSSSLASLSYSLANSALCLISRSCAMTSAFSSSRDWISWRLILYISSSLLWKSRSSAYIVEATFSRSVRVLLVSTSASIVWLRLTLISFACRSLSSTSIEVKVSPFNFSKSCFSSWCLVSISSTSSCILRRRCSEWSFLSARAFRLSISSLSRVSIASSRRRRSPSLSADN